ncbi:MAG: late competence development ComFB family protein [Oscillospiraceae bacterium]|jgi:competence protein ComFB|nr:late competence development ComFB family protein [Oscillospiraceae bacterium]
MSDNQIDTTQRDIVLEQNSIWTDTPNDSFILINANEEMVKGDVRKMMEFIDMCKCEKCFKDVCAIVLNKLPARYVTTRKGTLLSQIPQMSRENHAEMTILIAQALKMVSESPQH